MPMMMCPAGRHFYDPDKYDLCPTCEEEAGQPAPKPKQAESAQAPVKTVQNGTVPKTQLLDDTPPPVAKDRPPASPNAPKTTLLRPEDSSEQDPLPVTGWLVIVAGPGTGRDYRLIQGENRIGRAANMEICLDLGERSDTAVSREAHAIVVYDNNANEFFVERGSSRNLPLLNGQSIRNAPTLKPGDLLQIGNTKLLFVPLCQTNFHW